jgi:two-component system, NtrC family, response regulator AtoC
MSAPATASAVPPTRVLVVDDEENLRHLLGLLLARLGYQAVEARDGLEALALLAEDPDLRIALCDVRMPRLDGLGLLARLPELGRPVHVVMMSAYGNEDTAVDALARGAVDYVGKPFRPEELRHCLQRIADADRLSEENRRLRDEVRRLHDLDGFLGRSEAARRVMDLVEKVAAYPTTVLVTGESGTGKELLARALHSRSPRAERAFVAVNCAAIPASLLESELFGHARGAFTGAVRAHAGLFEQAHQGTLLLDEIGDMPLGLQTRLLRVLEDGRVRRLGEARDIEVDVRLVASTAVDLEAAVAAGRFRQDLFFRLNVVHVRVPTLRERQEDIAPLAEALVARAAARLGRPIQGVSPGALRVLLDHPWPGNVRQLENAMERAVLLADGPQVERGDLPPELSAAAPAAAVGGPQEAAGGDEEDLSVKRRVAALERSLIARALARTGGNRSQAARLLELSTKALVYKIRAYGLEP